MNQNRLAAEKSVRRFFCAENCDAIRALRAFLCCEFWPSVRLEITARRTPKSCHRERFSGHLGDRPKGSLRCAGGPRAGVHRPVALIDDKTTLHLAVALGAFKGWFGHSDTS